MGRHRPTPRYPETPPNLTWPELTEPPRADDGLASPNQLKLNDTDKIGVQNAGRQSRGITGGRQRFGGWEVVPVDRRHASSPNRQTLDAALVVEVDAGGDQDDQDGSDEPVDDQAKRRPPACIGHIVA